MNEASAPGKIILCGEYAVLFGHPGIAIPAQEKVTVTFKKDSELSDIILETGNWKLETGWEEYIQDIINFCIALGSVAPGTLTIENKIPLNKGMGSSTAFVIAICKALLGPDCEKEARTIEDALNPGHSGIDFAVIWNEKPIKFRKGLEPEIIELPKNLLQGMKLIDSGDPDQQTPELVAWITERKEELCEALETIGNCTERLLKGEDLKTVIRDHHRAQVELGVVTDKAKELITKIEQEGGAGKVLGAGSKTGGGGMILSLTP